MIFAKKKRLTEKQRLIARVPFFFHSIDCGDGLITPGHETPELLRHQLTFMEVPPLQGKTVLDIGAWDGYFSFAAELLGAERVMALDHYVWCMDLGRQQAYYRECRDKGVSPRPYHLIPGHWNPGTLPGKIGFDTVHQLRNSRVEQFVGDFMTIDPLEIGTFDIVFFLGVLYHMEDPFRALKRLALFTREMAIIATAAIYVADRESDFLLEFYEADELGHDVGNWFAPNLTALAKMCRAAGFKRVGLMKTFPPGPMEGGITRCSAVVHAYKA